MFLFFLIIYTSGKATKYLVDTYIMGGTQDKFQPPPLTTTNITAASNNDYVPFLTPKDM